MSDLKLKADDIPSHNAAAYDLSTNASPAKLTCIKLPLHVQSANMLE